MTAHEYADKLVDAISARVLVASGPVTEALIHQEAVAAIRTVMEDCAAVAVRNHARIAAVEIRQMKG